MAWTIHHICDTYNGVEEVTEFYSLKIKQYFKIEQNEVDMDPNSICIMDLGASQNDTSGKIGSCYCTGKYTTCLVLAVVI